MGDFRIRCSRCREDLNWYDDGGDFLIKPCEHCERLKVFQELSALAAKYDIKTIPGIGVK